MSVRAIAPLRRRVRFAARPRRRYGSFAASDPLLGRIWNASVQTATDMVAPGPLTTTRPGRPCAIELPQVLLDGALRDRCPYVGDQAVTGRTLLVSTPSADGVLRDMLLWYASQQHADGAIPASPYAGGDQVFFDYDAYWVQDLYDYVLYTGDLGARPARPGRASSGSSTCGIRPRRGVGRCS